jgi:putative sigma-54 modulation protein
MQVSVTFRNMESKEPLREYVLEKISKLKKYLEIPLEANVVLTAEKHRQIVEITILANRAAINAQDENDEILTAIDRAIDKLERQILKHKEKGRQHKVPASLGETLRNSESPLSANMATQSETKTVKTQRVTVPRMSLEEAAMRMDDLNYSFLLFQNVSSKDLNVLYRLKDGDLGLIVPQLG